MAKNPYLHWTLHIPCVVSDPQKSALKGLTSLPSQTNCQLKIEKWSLQVWKQSNPSGRIKRPHVQSLIPRRLILIQPAHLDDSGELGAVVSIDWWESAGCLLENAVFSEALFLQQIRPWTEIKTKYVTLTPQKDFTSYCNKNATLSYMYIRKFCSPAPVEISVNVWDQTILFSISFLNGGFLLGCKMYWNKLNPVFCSEMGGLTLCCPSDFILFLVAAISSLNSRQRKQVPENSLTSISLICRRQSPIIC